MREMWKRIVSTIRGAFVRTPVEVMIAVATAIAVSATIEDWIEPDVLAHFMITAFLLLCATFATSALHALKVFDGRTRWALTGVFGAAIVGYGTLWFDVELATEAWRFGFLAVAAVMGVALVPVTARLGDTTASERFWRFNTRLLFRVAVAGVYAGLLYGGVSLGVVAVGELFGLHVAGEIYGHLFSVIGIGLGTILAVGCLGRVAQIDRPYTDAEMIWFGRLGTFLFVPLLLFYLGIMYLYLGKVMITGDIPSNILSPLALGAGILGYAGVFALQPFLERGDHRPLAFVLKGFPVAFIPLVPMGIWAVTERIGQYGWTEFRYARIAALVCLGVFSLVGTYRWIRKKDFSLTYGPAIVGIIAFAGAVGPWGASYVSHASQKARMVEALEEHDLVENDGTLAPPSEIRASTGNLHQARQAATYLLNTHGEDALDDVSPIDLSGYDNRWAQVRALGFEAEAPTQTRWVHFTVSPDAPMGFERGGTFTDFSVSKNWETESGGRKFIIESNSIVVTRGGEELTVPLEAFIPLAEEGDSSEHLPEHLRHRTLYRDGEPAGEVVLRSVQFLESSDTWTAEHARGFVNIWPHN